MKSVRIQSYSGPHFPSIGLNTERYSVSLGIQSECGKVRTRITPNADTFYVVFAAVNDETPDDTLFDNSSALNFIILCARSHVSYFSEAAILI